MRTWHFPTSSQFRAWCFHTCSRQNCSRLRNDYNFALISGSRHLAKCGRKVTIGTKRSVPQWWRRRDGWGTAQELLRPGLLQRLSLRPWKRSDNRSDQMNRVILSNWKKEPAKMNLIVRIAWNWGYSLTFSLLQLRSTRNCTRKRRWSARIGTRLPHSRKPDKNYSLADRRND